MRILFLMLFCLGSLLPRYQNSGSGINGSNQHRHRNSDIPSLGMGLKRIVKAEFFPQLQPIFHRAFLTFVTKAFLLKMGPFKGSLSGI